jgi:hypothetical protein
VPGLIMEKNERQTYDESMAINLHYYKLDVNALVISTEDKKTINSRLPMVYMVQLAELSSTFPCERQTYDEF